MKLASGRSRFFHLPRSDWLESEWDRILSHQASVAAGASCEGLWPAAQAPGGADEFTLVWQVFGSHLNKVGFRTLFEYDGINGIPAGI
jgi:hypothetical protein